MEKRSKFSDSSFVNVTFFLIFFAPSYDSSVDL